ncbi:MAG: hypothetical protein B7Z72_07620 [Gemmatimonadetes bacterium 21-71-4]|nr:MAG: hypothetical protein B7Z72_07620 [Gemmatimonadetes bacterium 21-71-4]
MPRPLALPLSLALAAASFAAGAGAQQPLPPVRPLGPIAAVSTEPMKAVSAVRELPGQRVLVNDIIDHRVLLFDSTLAHFTAVADSTASTANAYGNMPGGLIPYRGDSTLFIDPASLSMLVLDQNGKVARVMAVPRPDDAIFLIGGPFGTSGFDPAGRLVFRGNTFRMTAPPKRAPDGEIALPQFPDSAPIVRVTLATRAEDTVAFFKIPDTKLTVKRTDNGISATATINPLPVVDDWALLPDGTVAVVRGRDFHIDWYHPDGTHTSTPKIPFDWQRLTDSLKAAVIDSARTVMEKVREQRLAVLDSTRKLTGGSGRGAAAAGEAMAAGMVGAMTMVMRSDGPGGRGGPPPTRGETNPRINIPPLQFVPPYELPDYRPAFATGATRCDMQGNLWIRTTQAVDGRPVYDVVNEQGTLVDRVQLPAFRTIAGFGPGVVYLGVADSTGAIHLERARIH